MIAASKNRGLMKQINRSQIRLLWFSDYWDAPMNGLCEYNGRKYWFELIDDADSNAPRRFALVELSVAEVAEEERWHELFRAKVGTHCDFQEPHPQVRPKEMHREFYEPFQKRPKPNYSDHPLVGWFEMN